MKTNILSFTVLAALLAVGCSKTEVQPQIWRTDPDAVIVDASIGSMTRSNPLGDDESFNIGDEVTIMQPDAGASVIYKFDGTSWSPVGGDYLVWSDKGKSFEAWYPAKDPSFVTDQSTVEGIAKADVMSCRTDYLTIPSDHRLELDLYRQCALVTVKIKGYNDEFDPAKDKITDMSIYLTDAADNADQAVKPYVRDASGAAQASDVAGTVGFSYSAIGLRADGSESKLFIEFKVGEKTLTVTGCPSLDPGTAYTFNLTVGKARIDAGDVTVSDWSDPVDLNEGNEFEAGIDGEVWDGSIATSFESGTGTETAPYIIATASQLAYLAQKVNNGESYSGKYFKQTSDLFLANKPWTPIGDNSHPFSGNFDGDGNAIRALSIIAETAVKYSGLFGYAKNGSIKDLRMESASISINNTEGKGTYAALLCGAASKVSVSGCSVEGEVIAPMTSLVAGIIGDFVDESEMSHCVAKVTVKGSNNVGGLCGCATSSNISDCSVVDCRLESTGYRVGGVAGLMEGSNGKITNCTVSGIIKGITHCGGLVGRTIENGGEVSGCTSKVEMSVSGNDCGGLVGNVYGLKLKFTDCGFDGTITKSGSNVYNLGATVGYDNTGTTFTNCWYNADKTGDLPAVGKSEDAAADKDYSGIEAKHLGN